MTKNTKDNLHKVLSSQNGSLLVIVLVITTLFIVIAVGIITTGLLQRKLNIKKIAKAQSLYIAEAGINYYRWVLYHDPYEYCNNTTCIGAPDYGPYGPYTYTDSSGSVTGYYELYITPPPANGVRMMTIKSVGWTSGSPTIKRTVEVRCGLPSWSSYSVLSYDKMEFSSGVQTWGRVHSNQGIRFDGVANNLVTAAVLSYDDPSDVAGDEFGVHTHTPLDPYPNGTYPPDNVPDNTDVFKAGRSFPVLPVSFDLLSNYVSETYSLATSSGGMVLNDSGKEGYHITLKEDDKIDIKIVNTMSDRCRYRVGTDWLISYPEKILTESNFSIGTSTPANGLIFVKDKVWVDGKINGNRVTILAFEDPIGGNSTDIILNGNITYTNYDGTDAIGLIAQRNIKVGLYGPDTMRVDAALIAKEGIIGREYFPNSSSNGCDSAYFSRTKITIYGSQAMRMSSVFAYSDGSGYLSRDYIYDNNLTYDPPPHFPTTGEYTYISWKEDQ